MEYGRQLADNIGKILFFGALLSIIVFAAIDYQKAQAELTIKKAEALTAYCKTLTADIYVCGAEKGDR